MTTIILTIIGILLAAVTAFMMFFYGGDSFTGSTDKSEASRLVGEGVQIQAAMQLYKAKLDKMPGDGNGVDATAMWDLVCNDYLSSIPVGINKSSAPAFDCTPAGRANASASSPWKIDYNYGIARSIIGPALTSNGNEAKALRVCVAARKNAGLTGDPLQCNDPAISNSDPCCIMSLDEAAG